jgi:hypothetical protein
MSCRQPCSWGEWTFSNQRIRWHRKATWKELDLLGNGDAYPPGPLIAGPGGFPAVFLDLLAALHAAYNERRGRYPDGVEEACPDGHCECEPTDEVIAGPTRPKRIQLSGFIPGPGPGEALSWILTFDRRRTIYRGVCVHPPDGETQVSYSDYDQEASPDVRA